MKLNVLTNARPTNDLGTILVAGCTKGQIKVSPDLAAMLKVTEGDRIGVGRNPEDQSEIFVFKAGEDAIAKGNKLAKSGSFYVFSSANVWAELEGDEEFNREFTTVGEAIEDEDGIFVQIKFDSAEPKQERKSSGKATAKEAPENGNKEVPGSADMDAPEEI